MDSGFTLAPEYIAHSLLGELSRDTMGADGFLFLTDSKSKLKSEAQNQIITLNRIFANAAAA